MCGRYLATTGQNDLLRLFDVDDLRADPLDPNPNVAPTEDVPAVVEHHGRRVLVTLRWGLIPSWAPDRRVASRLINARAETVTEKPAFRSAFERRRCLLPADGWYEWERAADGTRRPWRIAPPDGGPLAFAGLWEVWRDPTEPGAPLLRTCTVLTTTASDPLA
jgi:putative SOS response-associated peptidase YedK